jgi:hypothetical protein
MNYHQILNLCIRFLSIRMVLFSLFQSFRAKRSILFEIFNSNQNDKQNNSYFKKNFKLIKLLPVEFHLISFLYNCYPPSHEFRKILSPQKFGPRIATAAADQGIIKTKRFGYWLSEVSVYFFLSIFSVNS